MTGICRPGSSGFSEALHHARFQPHEDTGSAKFFLEIMNLHWRTGFPRWLGIERRERTGDACTGDLCAKGNEHVVRASRCDAGRWKEAHCCELQGPQGS